METNKKTLDPYVEGYIKGRSESYVETRDAAEKAFDEIMWRFIDSRLDLTINWSLEFRALLDDMFDIKKKIEE
jgi:hypothetical protein